jgi:CMP-N-acetylneuraminic acid synthetase
MICIIPARGGSERLPNKNILDLFGHPIISYPIVEALKADIFYHVVVSTDSAEIADIAWRYGAEPIMRPPEISGDVSETLVLNHIVKEYPQETAFCRVYPFACLLSAKRIISTSQYLKNHDAVMECQEYKHPPQRGIMNGRYWKPEYIHMRTQDCDAIFHDAGTLRWFTPDSLSIPLPLQRIKWCLVDEMSAQDIDDAEDFELAKLKFMRMKM